MLDLPENGARNIDVTLVSNIDSPNIELELLDADRTVVASGTTDVEGTGISAKHIGQGSQEVYTVQPSDNMKSKTFLILLLLVHSLQVLDKLKDGHHLNLRSLLSLPV